MADATCYKALLSKEDSWIVFGGNLKNNTLFSTSLRVETGLAS